MRTKLFALAAAALAGLAGLGTGLAVAQTDEGAGPAATRPAMTMMGDASMTGDATTMDQMHAAMRGQMPAEVADQCDAMHAAMPAEMRSMTAGPMGSMMTGPMGQMGSTMNGAGTGPATGPMADLHARHHES